MTRYGFFDVDDDEDDEEEPPHPIGFASPGRIYNKLRSPVVQGDGKISIFSPGGRSTYSLNFDDIDDDDDFELFGAFLPKQQEYPPISTYIRSSTASTTQLLQYREPGEEREEEKNDEDEDVRRLMGQLRQLQIDQQRKPQSITAPTKELPTQSQVSRHIQQRIQEKQHLFDKQNAMTSKTIKKSLEELNAKVAIIERNRKAEEDAQRQRDQDEQERKQAEEESAAKEAAREREIKKQQEEAKKKKSQEAADRKEKEAKKKAAATEYVARAKKSVEQLVQVRASIEPFEKNKAVSKRRLGFKKLARGKVNTLSENAQKVQEVAADVSQAIARARQDDEQIKQALERREPGLTPDMARGKRYLVDLLASGVVTRVQADGFNGPRGDGFPLAAMCAMISVEQKDIVPVLQAHIFTVCPTAIPTLPIPAPDCSEEELMSSLGMQKGSNGEYESFDKFLTRTENLVSIVADIMVSSPSTHVLFGGHRGAFQWLKRFVEMLPPPPTSPLPLLTAPVLHGFLTAAGHMMANIEPSIFKKYLDAILKNVMNRLDEGPIGKPSSIRLEKLVSKGFDGFKTTLPPKALPELYYGASGTVQHSGVSFGGTIGEENTQQNPPAAPNNFSAGPGGASPFVNPPAPPSSSSSNSPFGGGGGSSNANPSPFAAPSTSGPASNVANPFGGNNAAGFGDSMTTDNSGSNNNAFGANNSAGGMSGSSPSPFSGGTPNTGFGQATPFTQTNATNPSPFGAFSGGAASASPFGQPNNSSSHNNNNAFGASNNAGGMSSPSPFSGGATNTGFGKSTPFTQTNSSPSPFGQPAPGGTSQSTFGSGGGGFGNPSPSPFGGNQQPFGSNQQGSNFGGASQSPFGSGAAPSQQTPFGATPFGGGNQQQGGGFGGNRSNNGGRGRGGGRGQGGGGRGGGGGGKPPCKFFAQGRCKFGDNCKFSHDTGGGGGGGFGNNPSFGGNRSFGGNSGFGGSSFSSPSPFGGPRR